MGKIIEEKVLSIIFIIIITIPSIHYSKHSILMQLSANFKKVVKDVELSDDKIERIYRKLESGWIPYIENALIEIEEFNRFINLLAS